MMRRVINPLIKKAYCKKRGQNRETNKLTDYVKKNQTQFDRFRVNINFFIVNRSDLRGNKMPSGKGAPAREGAFTERNEATDSPRNFKEAMMALGIAKEMVDDGIIREDAMNAVPAYKQITFQGEFNGIIETH